MTTTTLRLDRSQLSKALGGDSEVVKQFEKLIALVNALPAGGGGSGVTSVNGDVGPAVVLTAGDVGAATVAAPAAAVAAHVALADPHTQYQRESERDAVNGYAGLDGLGDIAASAIPPTAVAPGSYTLTNLTVDAAGRITSAANGVTGSTSGQVSATFTGGADSVTVTVADAGVTALSRIVPAVMMGTRDADEMEMAPVAVAVGDITPGVGFSLIAVSLDGDADGVYLINYSRT